MMALQSADCLIQPANSNIITVIFLLFNHYLPENMLKTGFFSCLLHHFQHLQTFHLFVYVFSCVFPHDLLHGLQHLRPYGKGV